MFGRFAGMFGRIKDEALTYVAPGEHTNEILAKEEEKHTPEVIQQYVEDAQPATEVQPPQDSRQLELEESDMPVATLANEKANEEEKV